MGKLFFSEAKVVPELRSGKLTGMRLYAIAPEGELARGGFENADILIAINGKTISMNLVGFAEGETVTFTIARYPHQVLLTCHLP